MPHVEQSQCDSPYCVNANSTKVKNTFPKISFDGVKATDWINPSHVEIKICEWFTESITAQCGLNIPSETPKEFCFLDENKTNG